MMFVGRKAARDLLKRELVINAIPHLQGLGFSSPRRLREGYSGLWLRDRGEAIDLLDFQWDKYRRPSFGINFRDVAHPDDLRVVRGAPNRASPWDFGLHASMAQGRHRWFGPRLLFRWAPCIDREVARVGLSIRNRLTEVADFLAGGAASPYLCDSIFWGDKRLPENPPPWNDQAPGSSYHLPTRRAGTVDQPWGTG